MPKDELEGKMVVWPTFIDCDRPRSMGRRVPLDVCVKSPSLQEIERAAAELGLNPSIDQGASYPRLWYEVKGRVIVDKRMGRQETLRAIASAIKSFRQRS